MLHACQADMTSVVHQLLFRNVLMPFIFLFIVLSLLVETFGHFLLWPSSFWRPDGVSLLRQTKCLSELMAFSVDSASSVICTSTTTQLCSANAEAHSVSVLYDFRCRVSSVFYP